MVLQTLEVLIIHSQEMKAVSTVLQHGFTDCLRFEHCSVNHQLSGFKARFTKLTIKINSLH